MTQYAYKAQNLSGNLIKGTIEAVSEVSLLQSLREKGYYPFEIKKVESSKQLEFDMLIRVKLQDISVFCRQFATIISAGLTVVNALEILSKQTDNKRLRMSISNTFEKVQKGKTLSESMMQFNEFPSLFVNMIATGETSGQLEEILERMAVYYEKESRLRQKIRSALMYPAFLSFISIVVVIILVTKVLPMFVDVFKNLNVELPLVTRILLKITTGFNKNLYVTLGVLILITYCTKRYVSHGKGRYIYHSFLLRLPVLGKINKKIVTSRFARILSILLSSGIPIIQSIEVLQNTITNAVVEHDLEKCKDDIKRGKGLSHSIYSIRIFPPMMTQMIALGEETGMLDKVLSKTSQFYDDEVDIAMSGLTTIIEPIIIVLLAIVVGFIIISIVVPMFDMYNYMA